MFKFLGIVLIIASTLLIRNKKVEGAAKKGLTAFGSVTLVIGVLSFLLGLGLDSELKEPSSSDSNSSKENISDQTNVNKELSLEDNIENIVKKVAGEKTNRDDLKTIKSIEIIDNTDTASIEDKTVLISLNANDNFSGDLVRSGILSNAKDIFEKISDLPEVSEVVISNYLTTVDQFGTKNERMVLEVGLSRETMDKITWDNFLYDNFETIADRYIEHPVLE